jgi:hypothetical protein
MKSTQPPPSGCRSIFLHILRAWLDKLDPRPPTRCKPDRPIITFVPGHIGVLAEYPTTLKLNEKEIVRRVQIMFAKLSRREDILWSAERVIILTGKDRTLAAVFGDLPAARKDPARLLRFINQVNQEVVQKEPNYPKRPPYAGQGQQQPAEDRASSAEERASASSMAASNPRLLPDADGFRLSIASPNWLSSSASQHGGTGGPGARPIPATVALSDGAVQAWDFTLPPDLGAPLPEDSAVVEIAILDTAPRPEDLEEAYARLVTNQQPPHPLIARLLGEAGNFDISASGRLHAIFADTNMLAQVDADLAAHSYLMSDHGLFIAGIINSIAPKAKLHLIEVLNPYGVGTLESIAQGFQEVVNIRNSLPADMQLVINCSWMLNIPQDVEQLTAQQLLTQDIESLTLDQAQQMSQMLQDICLLASPPLNDPNTPPTTILVAAAGNDSDVNNRSQSRYPAAYPDVIGVGALMRDDSPAPYSNLSDSPFTIGYATFGGEAAPPNSPDPETADPVAADPNGGLLGVYIGLLNGQPKNPTGWARWAGTSFAAPIISGTLARLLGTSNITTLRDADIALRNVDSRVNIGEVVRVTQG